MDPWEQIAALRRDGVDAVVITITAARGSVPGQVGAKAIMTAGGLLTGNLGGGKVEAKALGQAARILDGDARCLGQTWNLQRDVGMTCGGEMSFLFEKVTAVDPWHIAIFGAGHVAQALVPVLATLACRIDVFDTRPDWLAKFPTLQNVTLHRVESFEDGAARIGGKSFVLAVTQGHSSDRAVLLRDLRDDGLSDPLLEKIICPVGLPIGGNAPAEIAISIAAQLLARHQQSRGTV